MLLLSCLLDSVQSGILIGSNMFFGAMTVQRFGLRRKLGRSPFSLGQKSITSLMIDFSAGRALESGVADGVE